MATKNQNMYKTAKVSTEIYGTKYSYRKENVSKQ